MRAGVSIRLVGVHLQRLRSVGAEVGLRGDGSFELRGRGSEDFGFMGAQTD